jgi:hypothetical protein
MNAAGFASKKEAPPLRAPRVACRCVTSQGASNALGLRLLHSRVRVIFLPARGASVVSASRDSMRWMLFASNFGIPNSDAQASAMELAMAQQGGSQGSPFPSVRQLNYLMNICYPVACGLTTDELHVDVDDKTLLVDIIVGFPHLMLDALFRQIRRVD